MSKIEMTKVHGKYAERRVKFLEEFASDMLDAMVADNSIYEHLDFIQDLVSKYVDSYVDKAKQSAEYKKAERECDLAEMSRIISTAQTTAEYDAAEEWICSVPDMDNAANEEVPEKEFDDMSYSEAVQDIYNDINALNAAASNLDSDENGTEDEE